MGKTFLNKEQIKDLEKKGWETPPIDGKISKDGTIWFGQDWNSKRNFLATISELFPDLLDASNESIVGYDFLVVGIRPSKGGK